jgi:hypothetical protein
MLSRSLIVEPEKNESALKRKPSKNMTEKEILNLRVPPPKNEKLFRESTDKPRLNSSFKESSSNSLITTESKATVRLNLS